MPQKNNKNLLGLVLSAGGSRAAYQVGVLRHIAENHPAFLPTIFTGISSGSINTSYLAQGKPTKEATLELYKLWEGLEFDDVFKTNFKSIVLFISRALNDLLLSKITRKLLFKSILDARPLALTLTKNIHPAKIWRAVISGTVQGVSVSTTNYHQGNTTIFFDSHLPIKPWMREQRFAVRASIKIRHIMASCSIPILFEPVRIGDSLHGDGSLRFSYPLSPAIHLGSSHILAIGTDCPATQLSTTYRPEHLSLGFVAGTVLNSIFLDSLESDLENLQRINRIADDKSEVHRISSFLIRPSQDPALIAESFISELPYHFRQLVKTVALRPQDMGDLISYLIFSRGYIKALLDLGASDAAAQDDKIEVFLKSLSDLEFGARHSG